MFSLFAKIVLATLPVADLGRVLFDDVRSPNPLRAFALTLEYSIMLWLIDWFCELNLSLEPVDTKV